MFVLIKTLTELPGMSGFEKPVTEWLQEKWKPYVEGIEFTGVGNLIAHVGGQGPKLLVEAHADEIGFVIKSIDQNGFIWVARTAAREARPGREVFLIGQPAVVQTDTGVVEEGFFAAVSGHVLVSSAKLRAKHDLDWDDIFVDIGASTAAEVRAKGVDVGNAVLWNPPTRRVGRLITGKAMDDRAGLAIMTELLTRLETRKLKYDLYFSATVQEELGLVGAGSLERFERFDLAIAVDVGLAGDVPGVEDRDMPVKLGAGPIFVHHDRNVHYDRGVIQSLSSVAQGAGIPVQRSVFPVYCSDGVELVRLGVPTALIAFPARYTHSPFESVDENDLKQCVDLLQHFLEMPLSQEVIGRFQVQERSSRLRFNNDSHGASN